MNKNELKNILEDHLIDSAKQYIYNTELPDLIDILLSGPHTANLGNPFVYGFPKDLRARLIKKAQNAMGEEYHIS